MREYKEALRTLDQMKSSDLALYCAGEEQCAAGYAYLPRVRPYHLIHFILNGKGRLYIDGATLDLAQGDAFIIPANTIAWYQADAEDPWEYAWLGFLGISSEGSVRRITSRVPETYAARHLDLARYHTAIRELTRRSAECSTSVTYLATSTINRVFSYLLNDIPHAQERPARPGIAEEARFYLEMNYFEPLRIDDVAQELNVSPGYLTRAFKEHVGVSPKRYLTDLKLNRAATLLERTDLSIGLIARAVGFSDQLAFSKAFKTHHGCSPRAWRTQHATPPQSA